MNFASFMFYLKQLFIYFFIYLSIFLLKDLLAQKFILILLSIVSISYYYKSYKYLYRLVGSIFSFGTLFTLFTLIFHIFSFLFFLFFDNSYDTWPINLQSNNSYYYVIYAEGFFIFSSTLMIISWASTNGCKFVNKSFQKQFLPTRSKLIIVIIFLFIFNFIIPLFIKNIGDLLGSIIPTLYISYIFLICLLIYKRDSYDIKNNIIIPILFSIPMIISSSKSGMKEAILISFFPLLFGIWLFLEKKVQKIIFLILLFIFFVTITVIVTATRNIRSEVNNINNIQFTEIVSNSSKLTNESDFMISYIKKIISRKNTMEMNAGSFYLIDQNLFFPEFGFQSSIPLLIPRFIWNNKPKFTPANDFAKISSTEISEDSDTPGFFTAIYLSSGFILSIVFSLFFGFFISFLQFLAKTFFSNFGLILFSINLFYLSIRLDEAYPVEILPKIISIFLITGLIGVFFNFNNKSNY